MATETKTPPASKNTATHKVLVVDDDPIIAESLAEFLMREGYEAATAFDAAEAMLFRQDYLGPHDATVAVYS